MEVGAKLKNDIELKGQVAEEIQMIIVSAVANTTAKATWGGERVCFSSQFIIHQWGSQGMSRRSHWRVQIPGLLPVVCILLPYSTQDHLPRSDTASVI